MTRRAAGLSDVGLRREANQDQYMVDSDFGLYAVADGMGGHAAGEVASGLAINALRESFSGITGSVAGQAAGARLQQAMCEGNRKICESMVLRPEWRGMGTTMVALLIEGDQAIIGHAGDSRAYRLRGDSLDLLTSDHSWVNEQVRQGLLSADEAHRHPMRNIVTRALGNQSQVEVDLTVEPVQPGDLLLLCSDGLNGMVEDSDIRRLLISNRDVPLAACRALVERANANGGDDNITVIVVAFESGELP